MNFWQSKRSATSTIGVTAHLHQEVPYLVEPPYAILPYLAVAFLQPVCHQTSRYLVTHDHRTDFRRYDVNHFLLFGSNYFSYFKNWLNGGPTFTI